MASPSTNGPIGGRNSRGQFAKGNPGGPGNPMGQAVALLRSALLGAVTEGDIRAIGRKLVSLAKAGDIPAARELLQRVLGPAEAADVLAELGELRQAVDSLLKRSKLK